MADKENTDKENNVASQVETLLRQKQEKKGFKDSEHRVGGAKKEMAAIRKIERIKLNDLAIHEDAYGDVVMTKFVKKNQVFPKFDPVQQKTAGVSSGAAFLKMKLRESFPNEPQIKTANSRKVYVGFADYLYEEFLNIMTIEAFQEKRQSIVEHFQEITLNFLFGLDGSYVDVVHSILEVIGEESFPYRTDYTSFADAYNYLKEYVAAVLKRYEYRVGACAKRLDADFGMSQKQFIEEFHRNIYTVTLNEDIIREKVSDYCENAYPGKDGEMFTLVVQAIKALNKIALITMQPIQYFNVYIDEPAKPKDLLWIFAMKSFPELRDKNDRPFTYDHLPVSDFITSFFSNNFYNFLVKAQLAGGTTTDNYKQALQYDSLSEKESEEKIFNVKAGVDKQIEKIQGYMTDALSAKTIDEFSALYSAGKVASYEPFLVYQTKAGRRKSARVAFNGLHDIADKKNWIEKYISYLELSIKGQENMLNTFKERYKPRPENWDWMGDYMTSSPKANTKSLPAGEAEVIEPKKRRLHSRPMLTYIERIGGLRIDKARVDNVEHIKEFMTEIFGFYAYEFGNALRDDEAREIVYHFLGAISDLSEVLNIDLAELNRKMRLSIGFATRGSGGASAHYENLGRIINLTKSNGDGCVAHELGHYLDNILPALDHPATYNFLQYASSVKSDKTHKEGLIQNIYVNDAVMQIMYFILYGKKKLNDTMFGKASYDKGKGSVVEYVAKAANAENMRLKRAAIPYKDLSDLPKLLANTYGMQRYANFENLSRLDLQVFDIYVKLAGLEEYTFQIPSSMSIFYSDSADIGGAYWVKFTELFSRAFEVYVFDKLAAAGRYNNYLCSGEYEHASSDYMPNYPYPQFEERTYLFNLFDNLFAQLKKAYGIGDFIPFTNEKNEHTKTEIQLVDSEIVKQEKAYEKKLRVLNAMLTDTHKRIVLSNGYNVIYTLGTNYVKGDEPGKYVLKSIDPDEIIFVAPDGATEAVSAKDFVNEYQPAPDELGTGGEFRKTLEANSDNYFYALFVKASDLLERYQNDNRSVRIAQNTNNRNRVDLIQLQKKVIPQDYEELQAVLTEMFNIPDWEKKFKHIVGLAFDANRAQSFDSAKNELLELLGQKIIAQFDIMDVEPTKFEEVMREINFIQLAIDMVNATKKDKTMFQDYSGQDLIGIKILTERGEVFSKKPDENERLKKQYAIRAQSVIGSAFAEMQVDMNHIDWLQSLGKEFNEHQKFGFDKVQLEAWGRSNYHATPVTEMTFGKKKSTVTVSLCVSPAKQYFFGSNYEYHNGGGGGGCWLSLNRAYKTAQEAYDGFFHELMIRQYNIDWSAKEKKDIIAEARKKLNISESVYQHAENDLNEAIKKENEEKAAIAKAGENAMEEMQKHVNVGDKLIVNVYQPFNAPSSPDSKLNMHECTVLKFENAIEISEHVREDNENLGLPEFCIEVEVIRPFTKQEMEDRKEHYGEEDTEETFTIYLVLIKNVVYQANHTYHDISNQYPVMQEPVIIGKKEGPIEQTDKDIIPSPQTTKYYHGTAYDIKGDLNNFRRGVGDNIFTLGDAFYTTESLEAAKLFSHVSKQNRILTDKSLNIDQDKRLSLAGGSTCGLGNVYEVRFTPSIKILDATVPMDGALIKLTISNIVPENVSVHFRDKYLTDFYKVCDFIAKYIPNQQNPKEWLTLALGYDALRIAERAWTGWEYYPTDLIDIKAFKKTPISVAVYRRNVIESFIEIIKSSPIENL